MIIYYSIYTGCCSVMTIDCFSLYIWVYKDIIYMKMTYCRSKTLMRKSMYWNILIYLQHHFDKNIVCHSHTKSLEKVIRVYHIWEGRYICIYIYTYILHYIMYIHCTQNIMRIGMIYGVRLPINKSCDLSLSHKIEDPWLYASCTR